MTRAGALRWISPGAFLNPNLSFSLSSNSVNESLTEIPTESKLGFSGLIKGGAVLVLVDRS